MYATRHLRVTMKTYNCNGITKLSKWTNTQRIHLTKHYRREVRPAIADLPITCNLCRRPNHIGFSPLPVRNSRHEALQIITADLAVLSSFLTAVKLILPLNELKNGP